MSNEEMKEKDSQGYDTLAKVIIEMITNENIDQLNNIDQVSKQVFSFLKSSPSQIFPDTLQAIKMLADSPLKLAEKTKHLIDGVNIENIPFDSINKIASDIEKEQKEQTVTIFKKFIDEILKQESLLLSDVSELLGRASTKQKTELEEIKKTLESRKYGFSYMSEVMEIIKRIRKEQEIKRGGLVKVSMNLQQNLFCRTQKQNIDFFESLGLSEDQDKQKEIECKVINHKGLSDQNGKKPTMLEHRAIDAIATILSDRNHVAIASNGNRKIFQMTMTEYLENFAVTKVKTQRGYSEFFGKEKEAALAALGAIETKLFDCLWKIPLKNGKFRCFISKMPMIQIIRCIGELEPKDIEILEKAGITPKSFKGILVIPSPIFWEHVDNYFCLKPRGMLAEIKKEKGKKNNRHINLFFEKICEQASLKKACDANMIWDTTIENLAYVIDLGSWIKTRQWKRIKATILDCLNTAVKLGYIKEYKIGISQKGKEKSTITINEERLYEKQ